MNSNTTTFAGNDLFEMDRRYAFHPFTGLADHERDGPTVMMTGGKGVWLEDSSGKRYLDGMAGLWCVNVGYGRQEIADAMRDEASQLGYCHSFSSMSSEKPTLLAERLVKSAPVPMSKVFFGNSGSDANDTQVKIAWYYNNVKGRPQKKKILSRQRAYHGVTIMAGGLTGLAGVHAGFDLPLPFVRHTLAPHKLWEGYGLSDEEFVAKLVADLERIIHEEGADTIAAMIMEPIMGAGGVIVPPPGYHAAVRAVLDEHDILLIADEVICGFGRLGSMYGCEAMDLKPDMITVAKGLTSAYFPLSGCMVSESVWRTIVEGGDKFGVFCHGYTYSAHPTGAAVAMANLDIIERDGLVAAAGLQGAYMHKRLQAAFGDHPLVGEIRGLGLIGAIELVARKDPPEPFDVRLGVAGKVAKAALARGIITRALPNSNALAFSPPFTINREEIDTLVEGVRDAVDSVVADLHKSGDLKS